MRTFISVELPEEVKAELAGIQEKISLLEGFKGKITEKQNLHLTLKFLGEIDEKKLGEVEERLKKLEFRSFKVHLGELGVFSERYIQIVWVSLEDGELWELQKAIDGLLGGLFEKEQRFMGHITIARPKRVRDKKKFIEELKKTEFNHCEFDIDRVYLRESLLSRRGPEYSDVLIINSA